MSFESVCKTFDEHLRCYDVGELIRHKMDKKDLVFKKMKKDPNYNGSKMNPITFEQSAMGNVSMGDCLTPLDEISKGSFLEGNKDPAVPIQINVCIKEKDLMQHKNNKKSRLGNLFSGALQAQIDKAQDMMERSFINNGNVAFFTADGGADGVVPVDTVCPFQPGHKFEICSATQPALTVWTKQVCMNPKSVAFVDAIDSTTPVDLSAYLLADNAAIKIHGFSDCGFNTLDNLLLPEALGGSDTIYGIDRKESMILQSQYVDLPTLLGEDINSSNCVDALFCLMTQYDQNCKDLPKDAVLMVNPKFLNCVIAHVNCQRDSSFSETKARQGFREVTILTPQGELKLMSSKDMLGNGRGYILDLAKFEMYSEGKMFDWGKEVGPDYYIHRGKCRTVTWDLCSYFNVAAHMPCDNMVIDGLTVDTAAATGGGGK